MKSFNFSNLNEKQRSELMSKIRSKNTRLEVDFFRKLQKGIGNNFQTHIKTIRGTPDIVFRKHKVCVFIDSDFWHGWQYPRWKNKLKNNFWKDKIENNRKRDRKVTKYLREHDWTVIRIWEHQLKKDQPFYLEKIRKFLLR